VRDEDEHRVDIATFAHRVWPAQAGALMQRLVEAVLIHHDSRGTRVLLRHTLPAVGPS
jgi:hypothetical protein